MQSAVIASLSLVSLAASCASAPRDAAAEPAHDTRVRVPDAPSPHGHRRDVAVLVFEGVELLDFSGPVEVFSNTERWDEPLRVFTVGADRRPVRSLNGVVVVPDYAVEQVPAPDVLVIPGGEVRCLSGDTPLARYIRAQVPKVEIVFSVCNGVFALTDDGWLDGLAATTHHSSIGWLRQAAPRTEVRDDARYVDNGHIVTAAGISAGIDGALHLVERLLGPECARQTAHRIQYEWREAPTEPDAVEDRVERARRAWYRGDWKAAVEDYRVLAEADPSDAVAQARYGTCLLFTRQPDAAMAALARAAELGLRDPLLYDATGYCRSLLEQPELALEAYATSVALDPGRLSAVRGLGHQQAELGRYAEAAENLQRVWDTGQGDSSMLAVLARSWAASGDRERALQAVKDMVDDSPEDVPELLADAAFDAIRGDPRFAEQARRAAEKVAARAARGA